MSPEDDTEGIYDMASPADPTDPTEDVDGIYDMASSTALAPALRQARLDRMVRPLAVERAISTGSGDDSKDQSIDGLVPIYEMVSQTANKLRELRSSMADPTCWDPTWDH